MSENDLSIERINHLRSIEEKAREMRQELERLEGKKVMTQWFAERN